MMMDRALISASLTALQEGDFRRALSYTRQAGGEKALDAPAQSLAIIEEIVGSDYSPLEELPQDVLATLRLCAAALEVWGTNRISDFVDISGPWPFPLTPNEIATRIHYHACHQVTLRKMAAMGVTHVTVVGSGWGHDCPPCRADQGRVFPIAEVPELPHRHCLCPQGCRCTITASSRRGRR